jgi:hypothetical protein
MSASGKMKVLRIRDWIAVAIVLFGTIAARADDPPQPSNIGEIQIAINTLINTFSVGDQSRAIFRNMSTASDIRGVYEPAFFPSFDRARSGPGKLTIQVVLDDETYKQAALSSVTLAAGEKLIRVPFVSADLALGPNSDGEPSYLGISPRVIQSDNANLFFVTFDVAEQNLDAIEQLAKNSQLRVTYVLRSQTATTTACSASLRVLNSALYSNQINGPVASNSIQDLTVAVTRNQVADAIAKNLIEIQLSCEADAGTPATTITLVADDARRLIPTLIEQMTQQNVPFQEALKQLANFSFNGDDAGTRIKKYLQEENEKIQTSTDDKLHVDASTEAKVLDLFGGKLSGSYDKANLKTDLRSHDFKFEFEGDKIVPASLNVAILKRGELTSVGKVRSQLVSFGGRTATARFLTVPVGVTGSREVWAPLPIGAVVPYFLSPTEVAALAPQWLPADGRPVHDAFSKMNGQVLPDLQERVVMGGVASSDVRDSAPPNVGGASRYVVSTSTVASCCLVGFEEFFRDENVPPKFVIDTSTKEFRVSDHHHQVVVDGVLPPFRRLVYMIRVR